MNEMADFPTDVCTDRAERDAQECGWLCSLLRKKSALALRIGVGHGRLLQVSEFADSGAIFDEPIRARILRTFAVISDRLPATGGPNQIRRPQPSSLETWTATCAY